MTDKAIQTTISDFRRIIKENVKREGIEDFLEWLDTTNFYSSPASTRYHGAYKGGLVVHSYNVMKQLLTEIEYELGVEVDSNDLAPEDEQLIESAVIVGAFHDVCKINTYEPYMRNVKNDETGQWEQVQEYRRNPKYPMGHGDKSVFLIMQYMLLTPEEGLAISWHMGGYDISPYKTLNECSQAWESSPLAFLLHIADMKATYLLEERK